MTSITIRISDDEKEIMQAYADDNDFTLSWVVRRAIKDFIKREITGEKEE